MALPPLQLNALRFMYRYHQQHGYMPSLREINREVGAPITTNRHTSALIAAGCVTAEPRRARSWQLTPGGLALVQAYEPQPRRKRTGGAETLLGASA